jgi:hypothetical protein
METEEKQQFFAARADQAEAVARNCQEPFARDAWITVAKIWRLLADNSVKGPRL